MSESDPDMSPLRRGLRAELASILEVDPFTMEDLQTDALAPTEPTTSRLSSLIASSLSHPEEVRAVYEFLPILMLRVFGFRPGQGWLETASELPSKDREALLRLTMPEGPIHSFCKQNSPPRDAKINLASDMRFEFPRSSLPIVTETALKEGPSAALKKSIKEGQSFLAQFIAPSLKDKDDMAVYLSPVDYFYVCMIASPTRKWTPPSGRQPGGRRVRRSVSLPSTRALYNRTIASYASSLRAAERVNGDSFFIASCLDFLFMPWASCKRSSEMPAVSTAVAEAVACLLLALVPPSPSSLDLVVDFRQSGIPETIDWRMQTNTSAVYRASETMLEAVLMHFDSDAPLGTLVVYIRILALYIAPWKASIRNTLSACLFPKKKASSSGKNRTPSMAALTSTLSTINAHLASPSGSPGNASSVKESQWRSELRRKRQRFVDEELVRLAIVKAANRRLPSVSEGGKVLALLAEATQAARLLGTWSSPEKDQDKSDELRSCLLALRNQKAEYERTSGRRDRNYIGPLASSVGMRLETGGVLGGISEIVGVGGGSGVAGVMNMVAGSAGGSGQRKLHERRLSAFRGEDIKDVPFLGNVWDRPISESENEIVLLWSYWLALRLEPRLGYVPNLRFLGRYWFLLLCSFLLCGIYFVRGIMKLSLG